MKGKKIHQNQWKCFLIISEQNHILLVWQQIFSERHFIYKRYSAAWSNLWLLCTKRIDKLF